MCCSAPFRLSVSFHPSLHVAHVDKCFKNSRGEKTKRRQQAALVTAVAPTLGSVWWCPLAGWGCPVRPRQKWQCSRSYLPPCMSAPRVHLLSSSLALTGKKKRRVKVSKVKTPHADGNFEKCNIASGPFKKTHELTTCLLRAPTTYLFPVRWKRYLNFSTRASRL